ncbi:hypothetical protein SAMN04515668_4809 [Hymenobacter arizonensis]|uniref:Uncharacterized protein n=1 Tax=Hymenobacter arizonensis TaxID=1227077 RepID=A0A1I6BND0_HYMAR|nr:hypothetical protein SAMN04515668_4809 [Hymenobacter arizonensis]
MDSIRIEKLGDINRTYAHLEVFQAAATSPFLKISITEEKTLCFTLFSLVEEVTLTQGEWERSWSSRRTLCPKSLPTKRPLSNGPGNKSQKMTEAMGNKLVYFRTFWLNMNYLRVEGVTRA